MRKDRPRCTSTSGSPDLGLASFLWLILTLFPYTLYLRHYAASKARIEVRPPSLFSVTLETRRKLTPHLSAAYFSRSDVG